MGQRSPFPFSLFTTLPLSPTRTGQAGQERESGHGAFQQAFSAAEPSSLWPCGVGAACAISIPRLMPPPAQSLFTSESLTAGHAEPTLEKNSSGRLF